MSRVDYKRLGELIKRGDLSGCYFLYGREQYLLSRYLDRLVHKVVPSGDAFNLQRFESEKGDLDWNGLESAVESFPMMAAQKAVLLHDLNPSQINADETERIKSIIENIPDTTVLIIYLTNVEITKDQKKAQNFIKWMEKSGTVVQFEALSTNDLAHYLVEEAKKEKVFLSLALADKIIAYCGTDMLSLRQNLHKVVSFTGSGGEVKEEAIDNLVEKTMDATAFDLANASLRGNLDLAMNCLQELKMQRAEPIMVSSALYSAFVDLYRAKCALEAGKTVDDMVRDLGYQPRIRFRVEIAFREARKISKESLCRSMRILHQLDIQLKTSRCNGFELLESTLVRVQAGIE